MKIEYFVLTVKDYLAKEKQLEIENEIAKYIVEVWKIYKIKCIFIPTGANPIEENDLPVAQRLNNIINNKRIFSIQIPKTPELTKKIIRNAKFAVCTRMHSAIFAITEYTPFIAIAYEHKSVGLLESLKLSNWYIPMNQTTKDKLISLTKKLNSKKVYNGFIRHLCLERDNIKNYRASIKNKIIHSTI